MNKALVSGASGFIGRVLCARLQRDGIGVRAVMRYPVSGPWDEARKLELGRDPVTRSLLEGIDTIFHLAGKAHSDSEPGEGDEEHQRITVEGTENLLAAAAGTEVVRFVYFSSVKAMGEHTDSCEDESAQCLPQTGYGRARFEAEQLVTQFGASSGVHTVNLRLPLVYGPGSKGNLNRMLAAVAAGRMPPLPDTGNKRSMVHVDDVVEIAVLAAETPAAAGKTYIVTDGCGYSTREIYDMMRTELGKPVTRWSIPQPVLGLLARIGDIIGVIRSKRFVFDTDAWRKLSESAWYCSTRVEKELGYHPRRSLRDALPDMVSDLNSGA